MEQLYRGKNKNSFQEAVECLKGVCNTYEVSVKISYQPKGVGFKLTEKWVIYSMGKRFINRDFVIACKAAVKFIYEAHSQTTLP